MGKKRKPGDGPPEIGGKAKLFRCYYCEQDSKDEESLVRHQQAKHFRCQYCHIICQSITFLISHNRRVHGMEILKVPGAIKGKDDPKVEVVGMDGIPGQESAENIQPQQQNQQAKRPLLDQPPPPNGPPPPTAARIIAPTMPGAAVPLMHQPEILATAGGGMPALPAIPSMHGLPGLPELPALPPLATMAMPPPPSAAPGGGVMSEQAAAAVLQSLLVAAAQQPIAPMAVAAGTAQALDANAAAVVPPMGSPPPPPPPAPPPASAGNGVKAPVEASLARVLGKWRHNSGDITVSLVGSQVSVLHAVYGDSRVPKTDFLVGGQLKYDGETGTLMAGDGLITWSNGSMWSRVSD